MQPKTTEEYIATYDKIPYSVISQDLPDYLKNDFYRELGEILRYYHIYQNGADFEIEGTNGDYIGSNVKYKKCRSLIDKEARFIFAHTPDFYINKNTSQSDIEKEESTILNDFLMNVLDKNGISDKLLKAAKDCFIGKRVGCILNFSPDTGINITFLKSYEFIYEKNAAEELTKFIAFYTVLDSSNKKEKRIKKKSYEMKNDVCYVHETLYDGLGNVVEEAVPESATSFPYIPAVVILNDGLSNDGKGESDVEQLEDMESIFSKMSNADIDAGRKNMNAVRYTIDASEESTSNLSSAPGAFWDIKSNALSPDPKTAQVGMLEASMSYSNPLKTTLDRIDNQMHAQLDVPNVNSEQLQGVITSGKTLKAIYWGLIVRCDEKMLAWEPALRYIIKAILDGAGFYPESASFYTEETLPDIEYNIEVENNYPLLEDDAEEKNLDLSEVASQTMSRKAYMKKWRGLTDEEVEEELDQILKEKQLFEDSMIPDEYTEEDMEGLDEEENLLGAEGEEDLLGSEEEEITDESGDAMDQALSMLQNLLKEIQ